jgi:quinoprotein relay system zinc metallohydrolase 2
MKTKLVILITLFSCIANAQTFMKEVEKGIYVHIGQHLDVDDGYDGDICNIGFIVGSDSIAVIDTGGSYLVGEKIKKFIEKKYQQPIKYVINTHAHLDHIYGNIVFEDAEIIGHENLVKAMKSRSQIYARLNDKYLGKISQKSPLVFPTTLVDIKKEKQIDLGDRVIILKAYPEAHTEADLTVLDQKTSTLWSGDLVFRERTPVIDGEIHGYIQALKDIKSKKINLIVPGHGEPSRKEKAVGPILNYLISLRDDIRKMIDNGDSLEFAIDNAAHSEKEKWVLFDEQNKRNVNRVYPMMEWE